jgi:D-3-phosphoglycerate dehydrogenase
MDTEILTESPLIFVFDFDSTFTQVEGLDQLSLISLKNAPDAAERQEAIRSITDKAMAGELSFAEALQQRVKLLQANKEHLQELIHVLTARVSSSFVRNKVFFEQYAENIYIVSSGFKEFIIPVVSRFGIKPEHVFANTFVFDSDGNIVGFDTQNPLSKDKGKVLLLKELKLKGDVFVVGDGYTDYEIREAGLADKFYAFTENVAREKVVSIADKVANTLDEILYENKMPRAISYPKSKIKVLVLENIHKRAIEIFTQEGYQIEFVKGALDEEELKERIKDVSILCIRSKTMVTPAVLSNASKLLCIGAFCIGTNQIALDECQKLGIAVFNAPYSNTRSVVELAVGEMILLTRKVIEKNDAMHKGKWDKSANHAYEIRGKKLGIVGYGNIGTQLSVVAEALGMQVYFYDIVDKLALGNAHRCNSLAELLQLADIVTLHVDGRASNKNLIGEAEFALMKDGVVFLNLSRGHVVDLEAMARNIRSGKIRGAAIDVFPYEPKTNDEEFVSELRGLSNVILTPHVGGSTEEAQYNIASFVPGKIIDYINTGSTYMSVNFPEIQLPELKNAHRIMHCHTNTPGILAQINSVLAEHKINILGQYLKTNDNIGYVITDVDKAYDTEVLDALRKIPHTIRCRVLY